MSNEVLDIDGISLRGQGFGASTRTGRYSVPGVRGENLVLAGSSGSQFVRNKPFEEGAGSLSLWAIGATTSQTGERVLPPTMALRRAAFEENMQTLMRLFTRPHRLSTIRTAQPDGSIRRAQVEWREWSEPEVQAGGTRAEWTISYTIPGVWWEDVSATTQSTPPSSNWPVLNLTNFAGMTGIIDDAQISVTGPVVNPRIQDMETGQWVQYSGTVSAGQTWTVDCGAFTSTLSGVNALANTTHSGGFRFLTISNCYGSNNYPRLQMVQGGSLGGTTSLSVTARRKWVHG